MTLTTKATAGFAAEAAYKGITVDALKANLLEDAGNNFADNHARLKQRQFVEAVAKNPEIYETSLEPAGILSGIQAETTAKQAELVVLEDAIITKQAELAALEEEKEPVVKEA